MNKFKEISEFTINRRNLPHWQLPGVFYFITFRTKNLILNDFEKDIIYESIIMYDKMKYNLISFVIMPDHIHLILKPLEKNPSKFYNLSEIMHSIKSFSAHKISNSGIEKNNHIFQHESFDRIIRNEAELYEKMVYIYNNPIKKALSDENGFYKWYYVIENW